MKRIFDCVLAFTLAVILLIPMLMIALAIKLNSKGPVFFVSDRVGQDNRLFRMIKFRSMKISTPIVSTDLLDQPKRFLTSIGSFLRRSSVDELPQLWNILITQMSFVGPRPDIVGYADRLKGDDRVIISIRPGITGPASIKYKNEELILSRHRNAEKYNDEVIWPDKVKINRKYINQWSFWRDMYYIYITLVGKSE